MRSGASRRSSRPNWPPLETSPRTLPSRARAFGLGKEDANATVAQCLARHLGPDLTGRNWKRIDTLGDKALRILCEKTEGILHWRGSPLPVPATGRAEPLAVPTLHPAFLARTQGFIPAVVSHLKKSLIVPPEHYLLTPTLEDVKRFAAPIFAFDIETDPATGRILCVGLSKVRTAFIPREKPHHKNGAAYGRLSSFCA